MAAAVEQEPPADSHERLFRRVTEAIMDRELGQRQLLNQEVGWQWSRDWGRIPKGIRRHQWSALIVPLLWAAAENDSVVAGSFLISPHGADDGLGVVRDVMRSIEIRFREKFEEWIHNHFRFPDAKVGRLHQQKSAKTCF